MRYSLKGVASARCSFSFLQEQGCTVHKCTQKNTYKTEFFFIHPSLLRCRSCVSSAAIVLAVVRVPAVAVVLTLAGAPAVAEIPFSVAVAGDLVVYIFAVASLRPYC